jgi:hypothetical protein
MLYSQPHKRHAFLRIHTSKKQYNVTLSVFLANSNSQLYSFVEFGNSFFVGPVPEDFLIPQNQTVLLGRRVTLYCLDLSESESSVDDSNTWLFRNITINQISQSNRYDVVDGGRVLVIRNVSVETSGVYTCRTASGEEYSAFVEVLGELFGFGS